VAKIGRTGISVAETGRTAITRSAADTVAADIVAGWIRPNLVASLVNRKRTRQPHSPERSAALLDNG
jgi:hypothetical protein